MSQSKWSCLLFALAVAGPFATANAQRAAAVAPDPADPRASVPPIRYDSAFARYRPNAEVEVKPWRAQNDTVGRIGGWRTYGREAIEPSAADRSRTGDRPAAGGAPAPHDHGHRSQEAR